MRPTQRIAGRREGGSKIRANGLADTATGLFCLLDLTASTPPRRQAFIDIGCQHLSAHDHLEGVLSVPTPIVWGRPVCRWHRSRALHHDHVAKPRRSSPCRRVPSADRPR